MTNSKMLKGDYKMDNYYFTFGMGQTYQGFYVKIIAESWEKARTLMCEHHGHKWSFQYDEDEWYEKEQPQHIIYGYTLLVTILQD